MAYSYTTFKGVEDISDKTPSEIVTENLISYFDYAFLKIKAYQDVRRPQSGIYGGNFSLLSYKDDKRFQSGQVWQSQYKNWVHETGVGAISISGVYVNNTFTTSGYYIDYRNGRVIFNSPISSSSVVSAEYSYKIIEVNDGESIPWLSKIDLYKHQISKNFASGEYKDRLVSIPCFSIEVSPISNESPNELGSLSRRVENVAKIHILSDNKSFAKKLADIAIDQKENVILLYDLNKVLRSGVYPLSYNGSKNTSAIEYPDLVNSGYTLNNMQFSDTDFDTFQKLDDNLYYSVVNITTSFVLF